MLPLLVLSEAVLVLVIVIEAVRRWRFGNAFNRDSQSGQPRHDPLRRDHRRTWVPTVVPTWVQDRVTSSEVRIPGYTSPTIDPTDLASVARCLTATAVTSSEVRIPGYTSRNDRPHRPRVGGSLPDRYRGTRKRIASTEPTTWATVRRSPRSKRTLMAYLSLKVGTTVSPGHACWSEFARAAFGLGKRHS